MPIVRVALVLPLCVLLLHFSASTARAKFELTTVLGGLSGGDLKSLEEGDITRGFKNSRLFGTRLGWVSFPIGVELSLVTSPSGLWSDIELPDEISTNQVPDIDTRVTYGEANLLIIPIPGPISPYGTVGFGVHSFLFKHDQPVGTRVTKFGWNLGGGIKANIQKVTLRFDVRDHVTTIGLHDFGLGFLGGILGFGADEKVHNIEISLGIGIRF